MVAAIHHVAVLRVLFDCRLRVSAKDRFDDGRIDVRVFSCRPSLQTILSAQAGTRSCMATHQIIRSYVFRCSLSPRLTREVTIYRGRKREPRLEGPTRVNNVVYKIDGEVVDYAPDRICERLNGFATT
jgi:hypothetical protein